MGVTIFGKTWKLHAQDVLRISPEHNLEIIRESVDFLVTQGRSVIYDAEHFFDGFNDEPDYALASLKAAADGGAQCLVLCDTNGGRLPLEIQDSVRQVVAKLD